MSIEWRFVPKLSDPRDRYVADLPNGYKIILYYQKSDDPERKDKAAYYLTQNDRIVINAETVCESLEVVKADCLRSIAMVLRTSAEDHAKRWTALKNALLEEEEPAEPEPARETKADAWKRTNGLVLYSLKLNDTTKALLYQLNGNNPMLWTLRLSALEHAPAIPSQPWWTVVYEHEFEAKTYAEAKAKAQDIIMDYIRANLAGLNDLRDACAKLFG